jgi:hypothetical protein
LRQKRGDGVGRGQGIRMSQDDGRCRNGKGRLKQKLVGRGDPKWDRKEKVKVGKI